MRMWLGVNPSEMCRKHLLGEHVELHMLAGSIEKGKSIQGFLDKGLVDPSRLYGRHENIKQAMIMRGFDHDSDMDCDKMLRITAPYDLTPVMEHRLVARRNRTELAARCPECAARMRHDLNTGGEE